MILSWDLALPKVGFVWTRVVIILQSSCPCRLYGSQSFAYSGRAWRGKYKETKTIRHCWGGPRCPSQHLCHWVFDTWHSGRSTEKWFEACTYFLNNNVYTVKPRNALAKRMKKMADVQQKFNDAEGQTDIQKQYLSSTNNCIPKFAWDIPCLNLIGFRFHSAVSQCVTELDAIHADISRDYSKGLIKGYTKEFLRLNANPCVYFCYFVMYYTHPGNAYMLVTC